MLRGVLLFAVAPPAPCRFIVDDDGGVNVRQPGRALVTERSEFISRGPDDMPEFAGLLKFVIDCVLGDILDRGSAFIPGLAPCTFVAVLVCDGVKNRCELGGTFRIDDGLTERFVGL